MLKATVTVVPSVIALVHQMVADLVLSQHGALLLVSVVEREK